jgi:hypothetical protein
MATSADTQPSFDDSHHLHDVRVLKLMLNGVDAFRADLPGGLRGMSRY